MELFILGFLLCLTLCLTAGCEAGWFGTDCLYQCHCTNNGCDNNGTCKGKSKCRPGWFGPACQFSDLTIVGNVLMTSATSRNVKPVWNNETCYSLDTDVMSVFVTWDMLYYFTWLRIIVKETAAVFLHEFAVEFRNNTDNVTTQCYRQRNATVNNRTLDLHCDLSGAVSRVIVKGKGIKYLCSLHISGGHNVALKQNTTQSSDYGPTYISKNAVDGILPEDTSADYCTHTGNEHLNPIWTLRFLKPHIVSRYIIYNRNGSDGSRLKGFVLTSFDENQTKMFKFEDKFTNVKEVYSISSSSPLKHVSSLTISVAYTKKKVAFLTLCEVEAYSESQCPPGEYGRECTFKCNCNVKDEVCFSSTGGCPSGCLSGYTGESCSDECEPGKFGVNCVEVCNPRCLNKSCNRFNGLCDKGCVTGFKPFQCTQECDDNYYGVNCSSMCSTNCRNQNCNASSGTCFFCNPGYLGEMCNQTCEHNMYGQDCKYNCSEHCLTNGTERVCSLVDDICLFGCASGSTNIFCNPSSPSAGETSSVTFGVAFGIVFLVLLVVVVALILWRRRRCSDSQGHTKTKNKTNNLELEFIAAKCDQSAVSSAQQDLSVQRRPYDKLNDCHPSEDKTYESYFNKQEQSITAILVDDLESFMLSTSAASLKSQFEKIPIINKDASMNAALSAKNKQKNRYKNICAYDHSRVTLTVNREKNEGDYINASFIEGYKNEEKFIASQAPTKVMINDFIRMLWEYRVEKVVMLTNLVEDGKSKCEKYWPDDGSIVFGEIEVHLATTHVFADYTIRKLKLQKDGQTSHIFTHFHFTSWPDKGVPATPWPLVDFEQRVASYPSHRPIVVHCSAGVGRTGTFIALCNVIREAKETSQIDFFRTLTKLRTERVQMIQTYEQYIFLHKAAQMAIVYIGTTILAEDITNRIAALELTSTNGETNMEKEFNGICSLAVDNSDALDKEVTKGNLSPIYGNSTKILKDRFSNIVPDDTYQPVLNCETRGLSNYINAVLAPSFTRANNQILTQLPLPTTIKDFWRLVMQHRVSLIVAFEADAAAIDSSTGEYLPSTEGKQVCELYDIKAGPKTYGNFWVKQDIDIASTFKRMSIRQLTREKLNVTHLKITTTNLDPDLLLSLVTQIRSCRSGNDWKTLYMCRNGAEFSGLACVLTLLLDRMDNDLCLTVPLVVGAIKFVRPQVIPTLEQYTTLYAVLKLYTESTSVYSNFGEPDMKITPGNSTYLKKHTENEDFNVYSNT